MGIRLKKRFAILLFCCIRQAERSVHFAYSNPPLWDQFLEYYDASRRGALQSICNRLYAMGARGNRIPEHADFNRFVASTVWYSLNYFRNLLLRPIKRSWCFTEDEVTFFAAALNAVDQLLDHRESPAKAHLFPLRVGVSVCREIMEIRMAGMPQIKKAMETEHFCQSDFLKFYTPEEIVGNPIAEVLAE